MLKKLRGWLSAVWRGDSGEAPSLRYCQAPVRILGLLVSLFGVALCLIAVSALLFGERHLAENREYLWGGLGVGLGLMMLFQAWSSRMDALLDEGADELRRQTDEMERDNARRLAALQENIRKVSDLEKMTPSEEVAPVDPKTASASEVIDELVLNQRKADLAILSEQVSSQADIYEERQQRLKIKQILLTDYEKKILDRDAKGEVTAVWGPVIFAVATFLGAFLYPMAWTSSPAKWACRAPDAVGANTFHGQELLVLILVASLITAAGATRNVRGARSYRALCASASASLICFAGAAVGALVFSACRLGAGAPASGADAALLASLAAIAAPFVASIYIAAARPRAED